jgi:hypothetical protein
MGMSVLLKCIGMKGMELEKKKDHLPMQIVKALEATVGESPHP